MISIAPVLTRSSQSSLLSKRFKCPCVGLIISLVVSVITVTVPSSAIANEASAPTEERLPSNQAETITLGRSAQDHYVVLIPVSPLMLTPEESIRATPPFVLLQKIRTIAPKAFLARHSLGHYIYVGGFDRFELAQQQLRQIQPTISNARVVYFP